MLGVLALLIATLGTGALVATRAGVLDRWSLPYHALTLVAIALAVAQWRRGRGGAGPAAKPAKAAQAARTCGILGAAIALFISVAIETVAPYPADRPRGPEVGASLAQHVLASAIDGKEVPLAFRAGGSATATKTLLVCFRGFW